MKQYNDLVDAYIYTLPDWEQEICHVLRAIIHSADADIKEVIKRTDKPYFVLNGNICALLGAKDHVNLFIYDPTVSDPHHLINQGASNVTAKAIQFFKNDVINEAPLRELLQEAVAHNRMGGWRRINK